MKGLMMACSVLALGGCVAPGIPTNNAMGPNASAQMEADYANMTASQAAAQLAAVRPGDEALSCEALQAELQTTMNDPKMQAAMASMGANSQAQMDKMKSAQAGALAGAATTSVLGIAGSFIPGLSWFSQGAAMAQQTAMQSQMAESNKSRSQMMADLNSVMPQIYRGQRIYDLATAKKCAFVNQPKPA